MGASQFERGRDPTVTIDIDGVDAADVAAEIQNRIRQVCREVPHGAVTIALAPSGIRGRWSLIVNSGRERHLTTFSAQVERVLDVSADHLHRILRRVQSDGRGERRG